MTSEFRDGYTEDDIEWVVKLRDDITVTQYYDGEYEVDADEFIDGLQGRLEEISYSPEMAFNYTLGEVIKRELDSTGFDVYVFTDFVHFEIVKIDSILNDELVSLTYEDLSKIAEFFRIPIYICQIAYGNTAIKYMNKHMKKFKSNEEK